MAQVSRPIKIFVPARLVEVVKGKRNADAILYTMFHVLKLPANNKRIRKEHDDYLSINKQKLSELINCNADSCIKFLLRYEFLERDNEYIPTKKSYRYRVHPDHVNSIIGYEITKDSPLYSKLIKKYRNRKANYNLLPDHLRAMQKLFNSLRFDLDSALNWINDNADTPRKMITYTIATYMMADKRQRFFRRNRTNNRLDTNLTNIKSELRNFLIGEFVQIDLKNSQPFFLSILLNTLFTHIHPTHPTPNPNTSGIPLCSNLEYLHLVKHFGKQQLNALSKIHKKSDFSKFMNYWGNDFGKFSEWVTSGLLYDNFIKEYGDGVTRGEVKDTMFAVLFSRNATYKNHTRYVPYEKEKQVFRAVFPTVSEAVEVLKTKNHAQLAILLQRIESYVFIDCIAKELVGAGITPLTIHDSVIIQRHEVEKTQRIINGTFERIFGTVPTFGATPLGSVINAQKGEILNDNPKPVPYPNGVEKVPKIGISIGANGNSPRQKRPRIKHKLVYTTAV